MEYETVTAEAKLEQINNAIAGQEAQHYQLVLNKIANSGNPAAVGNIDAQLRVREQAITSLRAERDREKAALEAAPPAPAEPVALEPHPTEPMSPTPVV